VVIDYTKLKIILHALLMNELKTLAAHVSGPAATGALPLNTIDRFEIGVSKTGSKPFLPILHDTISKRYQDYKRNVSPTTEKKKQLMIQLISLARRMNFNTDDFRSGSNAKTFHNQ